MAACCYKCGSAGRDLATAGGSCRLSRRREPSRPPQKRCTRFIAAALMISVVALQKSHRNDSVFLSGSISRRRASPALIAGILASSTLQPADAEQNWWSALLGLAQDEEVVKEEEQNVERELQREPWTANPFERARLMNLEAVLKAEESTIEAEEMDVKATAKKGQTVSNFGSAFERDKQRLAGLEKLAGKLRFSDEESKELTDLQRLLPK
eukprot:TRINITY_DN67188_c0_g1_i1.p1 TRINITY_DN67188_c0_g1~~TRINITY_DN67188_c0_g1_i1.p1  ORF type:complete len:223 (+),score=57.46 TRINITY_DN67188_c0_g1_i1:37-669(+)